jgi:long-chain acyl-CoA synthetase
VMKGYYKDPEQTAQVIKDGWFHTGDIGEFVEGKYLKITDRKKEMFKTSGGKYIAPQVMENKFKESTLIEQIAVIGDNQKFPSALIVPMFDGLRNWCKEQGIAYTTNEEMIKNSKVLACYQQEVDRYNHFFAQWEKIKKFKLLATAWTIESGELTPTMKLKRRIVHTKFQDDIKEIYAESGHN